MPLLRSCTQSGLKTTAQNWMVEQKNILLACLDCLSRSVTYSCRLRRIAPAHTLPLFLPAFFMRHPPLRLAFSHPPQQVLVATPVAFHHLQHIYEIGHLTKRLFALGACCTVWAVIGDEGNSSQDIHMFNFLSRLSRTRSCQCSCHANKSLPAYKMQA